MARGTEPEVQIRAAAAADVDVVADLATRFFADEGFELPEGGLRPRVEQYLRSDGRAIVAAHRGERLIGFATIATGFGLEYGWVAELEDLYVVPDERRQGIARALVERAAAWAAERGCSAVLVTVTPEGERAHALTAFYARLGFDDRGRRLLELPL